MSKSKIKTEVHTHTIASVHAYATAGEMMAAARQKGIELLAPNAHLRKRKQNGVQIQG